MEPQAPRRLTSEAATTSAAKRRTGAFQPCATARDEHPPEPKEPGMDRGARERPPDRP